MFKEAEIMCLDIILFFKKKKYAWEYLRRSLHDTMLMAEILTSLVIKHFYQERDGFCQRLSKEDLITLRDVFVA